MKYYMNSRRENDFMDFEFIAMFVLVLFVYSLAKSRAGPVASPARTSPRVSQSNQPLLPDGRELPSVPELLLITGR